MVGGLVFAAVLLVEALSGRDGEVLVDLVGSLHADGVLLTDGPSAFERRGVGELVFDTAAHLDWLAPEALEASGPSVDSLEGVSVSLLDDLVAASHSHGAGHIGTEPVEAALLVSGAVDHLWPDFLEGLGVVMSVHTNVDFVGNLKVESGLHFDGRGLVVLASEL